MPTTIDDIKLTVRNLLRAHWDNGSLPESLAEYDIHTGWFDDGKSFPQVSVTNNDDSPYGGGETGYSGIAGDGSGGVQTRSGVVLVTAWAGSRDDYDARGEEELQASEMASNVEEIVGGNQSPGSLRTLSVGRRRKLTDTDETPVEHYVQFEIRYTWMKTPT